jgi:hypothetical protein
LQVPLPSHVAAETKLEDPVVHDDGPQVVSVPHFRQLPAPSHVPSVPHDVGAVIEQSSPWGTPARTRAHVPSDLPVSTVLHAWHCSLHAVEQQTPSAQWPLAHPPSLEQAAPSGRPFVPSLGLASGEAPSSSPPVPAAAEPSADCDLKGTHADAANESENPRTPSKPVRRIVALIASPFAPFRGARQ